MLRAGLAVVAGDLLGLALGGEPLPSGLLLLLAAVLALVAGSVAALGGSSDAGSRPGGPRRWAPLLLLLACAAAGFAVGHRAGRVGEARGAAGSRDEAVVSLPARLRAAAARRMEARLPPDVAGAGVALVTAERASLDPEVYRRFSEAGLAHVLAISGLHVGLLGGGLLWLLARAGPLRDRRYGTAAATVAVYVLVLGAPPSAVRAAVVFGGWCAARSRGRPLRVTELLGAAALVGVLLDPPAPTGPGWQLSFAGFAGLLVGGGMAQRMSEGRRRLSGPQGRRRRRALVGLAASTGAFLATAPFAAHHFGRTAPVAVLASLVGVPLIGLALPALVAAALLPGTAGELAGGAAAGVLRLLFRLVGLLAEVPGGHGTSPPPGWGGWIAVALVAAACVRVAAGKRPILVVPLLAAAFAISPLLAVTRSLAAGGATLICQLDVGQGDAAVVRTRRGHWVVLDAGPAFGGRDAGLRAVLPFLRERGGREIGLLVLSHPHLDHLGGATSLLRELRVRRMLDAGTPTPSEAYAELLARAGDEELRWIAAVPGDRLRLDEAEFLVLGPSSRVAPDAPWRDRDREANEASVALRLRVGRFTYLNTGDAPVAEEYELLGRWPVDSLRATLLKAGHHGSRTSSSPAWLAAVRAKAIVVSVGERNRYGHPHPAALERLRAAGPDTIWRTDRDGTLCVRVRLDGRWRLAGESRWREP